MLHGRRPGPHQVRALAVHYPVAGRHAESPTAQTCAVLCHACMCFVLWCRLRGCMDHWWACPNLPGWPRLSHLVQGLHLARASQHCRTWLVPDEAILACWEQQHMKHMKHAGKNLP